MSCVSAADSWLIDADCRQVVGWCQGEKGPAGEGEVG